MGRKRFDPGLLFGDLGRLFGESHHSGTWSVPFKLYDVLSPRHSSLSKTTRKAYCLVWKRKGSEPESLFLAYCDCKCFGLGDWVGKYKLTKVRI